MSIPQRKTGVEKDGLGLACENVSYPEWNTISPMPSCLIKPWETDHSDGSFDATCSNCQSLHL